MAALPSVVGYEPRVLARDGRDRPPELACDDDRTRQRGADPLRADDPGHARGRRVVGVESCRPPGPVDLGEDARRAIIDVLEQMGFEVEAAHHEVAHGQHEIDFRYADALETADNIATFRFVVKQVAQQFGLLASFMPKPIFEQAGTPYVFAQATFMSKLGVPCQKPPCSMNSSP